MGILPPTLQMRPNKQRKNSDEYCRYKKAKGHDTANCWQLKNAIEDIIHHGWIKTVYP